MTTSGTYAFTPPISELVLEAYERCGKIGIELTPQFMQSARRSLNLVLSSWANRGVNLWTVQQVVQYMPAGQATYLDDASCVDILSDSVFMRQYQMGVPASVAPAFSTTSGSNLVTIGALPATPAAGGYVAVTVPVSVGGVVLQGFYQVVSVPGINQAIVLASQAATTTVVSGGAVPSFTATAGSSSVLVTLANHGLETGQDFTVQIATAVGGVILSGAYPVASVSSANAFTIVAASLAGSSQILAENSGLALLAVQAIIQGLTQNADPVDIMMYPLSRGDYQAIPDKLQQGRPTSFWINRQIVPVISVWPVPDQNGPYELHYWRSRQIQDADLPSGQTLGVPYRLYESFAADLAAHLAMKWAPERAVALAAYAASQWEMAADEDRERTSTFLTPDVSSYYQ